MGKIWMPGGGGGGVSSDELTAALADVVKGKTAVTSDSGDEIGVGTLELTGNAAAGDVVSGKGFYTTDPKTKQAGTLADKNGTTQSATASLDTTNSRLQMTIPVLGRYNTSSKLYAAYSTIRDLIGLTAAKIATGNTILGLAGTYKGLGNAVAANVLSGKTFSTASLSNATGTMTNNGAVSKTITPSASAQSYTIPAGYHNGSGKVTVPAANIWKSYGVAGAISSTSRLTFTDINGNSQSRYYVTFSNLGFVPKGIIIVADDTYMAIWYHPNENAVVVNGDGDVSKHYKIDGTNCIINATTVKVPTLEGATQHWGYFYGY